jgi:hypothetical protein
MKLRCKIQSTTCQQNICFVSVDRGRVKILSRSAKPIHISSLAEDATELLFALEEAKSFADLESAIKKHCKNKEVVAI